MTLTPAYLGFLYAVILAMVCGALALHHLRRAQHACFFCGTRNGKHSPDCPWERVSRQTEDEDE
jgi:hypothetical protein